jgi:predicted transposase/invertase (TIGR01784 family)
MPPEMIGSKFCRLDIHMVVDGSHVDLEVQVKDEGDFAERSLFHWARMYSNALPIGGNYSELPRTVIIGILDFDLFSCAEYHSEYQALEVTRGDALTDRMVLHFYELTKLPKTVDPDNRLELWLSLFNANTEEELKQIDTLGVPEMSVAIDAYRRVTASPEFQEIERLREKASHDEAQALYNAARKARAEGKADVAKELKLDGMPTEKIARLTGLSVDVVNNL